LEQPIIVLFIEHWHQIDIGRMRQRYTMRKTPHISEKVTDNPIMNDRITRRTRSKELRHHGTTLIDLLFPSPTFRHLCSVVTSVHITCIQEKINFVT
jgi:hypothetical protein